MIRHNAVSLLMALFILLLANSAHSAVQLYTGRMEILTTSGKACEGLAGTHDVSMSIKEDDGALSGYFIGGAITIGRFSGSDPARLSVRYPFQDEQRAAGHFISISRSDSTLVAELHDRHIDANAEDCNFDLARLELNRATDVDAAARLAQMTGQFDAQMTRSQAMALAQNGGYAAAVPYFEKALALADTFLAKDSDQIDSYLIGLATCYIWLDRFDEFNRLYDARITGIHDEEVRSVFSGYRAGSLMTAGLAAIGREEYDLALKSFEQAYKLQPRNREAIAAIMSVYVRSGRYSEAVAFLEQSESKLASDADRRDIRAAEAIVLFKKAQKDDKDGNGPEAETALKRAMELDPGSAYYPVALARLRHKDGNPADAERILEQALERFTDESSRNEILAARERMRLTEQILKKIRKAGN